MASPDRTHKNYAKACQKKKKKKKKILLSQLQYIFNIDTRKLFNNAHVKPHKDYASVVWDGCGEVNSKQLYSLHRRAGKLILPDPSLSTEQKISALAYKKGIFSTKFLIIIPQITWRSSLISPVPLH